MVEILDPKQGAKHAEGNVLRALHLANDKRKELRRVAGEYKAALIGQHRSRHVGIYDEDRPRPTSNEAHSYAYGYGKGYEAATEHLLTLLCGEEGHGMFRAWAEPLDGDR